MNTTHATNISPTSGCWHSRTAGDRRATVLRAWTSGGVRMVEFRQYLSRGGRPRNTEVEALEAFLQEWEQCEGNHAGPTRGPSIALRKKPHPRTSRVVLADERRGITPRIAEVMCREQEPALLAELARERPYGACIICWRDIPSFTKLHQPLTCSNQAPDTKTSWCGALISNLKRRTERLQEKAKQSLLAEEER